MLNFEKNKIEHIKREAPSKDALLAELENVKSSELLKNILLELIEFKEWKSVIENIEKLSIDDQKEVAIKIIENGGVEHIELNLPMFNSQIQSEIEKAILKDLESKCALN